MTFCANRTPDQPVACSPCACGKEVEARPVPWPVDELKAAVVDAVMRSRFRKFRTDLEESA